MAKVERFEDLEVWRHAKLLASTIYRLTNGAAFARDFGLRDQIRRAAVSIVSNIAEGFGRKSNFQFLHFLEIASGSTAEVEAQLYIALDLGYISQSQFDETFEDANRVGQMLTIFMQYLRGKPNRPAMTEDKGAHYDS